MHEILVFSNSGPGQDVEKVMSRLAVRMNAFQRSIEYVQDYIDLPGLKVWQEELSRVVYYNIEQVKKGEGREPIQQNQILPTISASYVPTYLPTYFPTYLSTDLLTIHVKVSDFLNSHSISIHICQECNRFLKKKVYDHQSKYQSRAILIPRFPPLDAKNVTFMGRVLGAVLRMTDPKTTIYAPEGPGWFQVSDVVILLPR